MHILIDGRETGSGQNDDGGRQEPNNALWSTSKADLADRWVNAGVYVCNGHCNIRRVWRGANDAPGRRDAAAMGTDGQFKLTALMVLAHDHGCGTGAIGRWVPGGAIFC